MPEAAPPDERSPRSPLMLLEPLAVCEVAITPSLHHVEVYTLKGLLTFLWHGPRDTPRVVITCGVGMGSLLGPAGGIYHDLGERFARDDIATIRVGYRRPNHLPACVHDLAAAAHLGSTPLLLCHGLRDEILPAQTSEVVRLLAGQGELVTFPTAGHLLDLSLIHISE